MCLCGKTSLHSILSKKEKKTGKRNKPHFPETAQTKTSTVQAETLRSQTTVDLLISFIKKTKWDMRENKQSRDLEVN